VSSLTTQSSGVVIINYSVELVYGEFEFILNQYNSYFHRVLSRGIIHLMRNPVADTGQITFKKIQSEGEFMDYITCGW
jgi:hypothetical protein